MKISEDDMAWAIAEARKVLEAPKPKRAHSRNGERNLEPNATRSPPQMAPTQPHQR